MEKLCRKCNQILPLDEFKNIKGILTPNCLSCDDRNKSRYVRDGIYAPKEHLDRKHQRIVREGRELLELMGYNLELDIHQQFLERARKNGYNL